MVFQNIIERLDYFAKAKGLNDNKITVDAGLSVGSLGKSRKSKGGLYSDSIEKILCAYSDLNPEWLLTGKGEMLKALKENHAFTNQALSIDLINEIKILAAENALLKKENEELKRKIDNLFGNFATEL